MKSPGPESFTSHTPATDRSPLPVQSSFDVRGPIEFRFVLKFAPQMSTPCSRGVAVKPRPAHLWLHPPPRLFQNLLQRHSVMQ
jgi:hypothetical protein